MQYLLKVTEFFHKTAMDLKNILQLYRF